MASKTPTPERFVEYSAGSDALPWRGWLEDESGNVTGWVDLGNRVHRLGAEHCEDTGELSIRNAAWNAVRDNVRAAGEFPIDPEKTDYWPDSNLACILSLAMKEIGPRIGHETGAERERSAYQLRQIEQIFFTLAGLGSVGSNAEVVGNTIE